MTLWIRNGIVPVLLGIALAFLLGLSSPATAQGDPQIAVVDISKVFNEHPLVDGLEGEIRKEQERYKQEYNAVISLIGKRKDEQRELEEGCRAWRELDAEIAALKEEAKIRGKGAEQDLTKQAIEATNELLEDIEKKIRRYCQQNGITLCFKIDTIPLRGSGMELALKSVLYYEPTIDITQEIIDIMKK